MINQDLNKVSIREASDALGVSRDTLRVWEAKGIIVSERTAGGHRRYDLNKLRAAIGHKVELKERKTYAYARVSSHDQKEDLERQKKLLSTYCSVNGWNFAVIEDLGSGLNYKKKGLTLLIEKISSSQVERLVLTNKDRLLRFGSEIIFKLCDMHNVEIVIINENEESTFEQDLVRDVLEIITVFSARLYGSRSGKNRRVMKKLEELEVEITSKDTDTP